MKAQADELLQALLRAPAAQAYLLETAPLLALQLDAGNRVLAANEPARGLFGEQVVGGRLPEHVLGWPDSLALTALPAGAEGTRLLTVTTLSANPQTLYFHFFPLPEGMLAFGRFADQRKQHGDLLALHLALSQQTDRLEQAQRQIEELRELKTSLTQRLQTQSENQRDQMRASLNLMEDALAARARAEQIAEALRASEARARAIFENAPDAAFIVYPWGRCVNVNATTLRRYGYSEQEFLTMHPADLAVPSLAAEFAAQVEAGFSAVTRGESRHRTKSGREFPVDLTASPLILEGVACALCIVKDSSERKLAEAALNRSELRCRAILEAVPDPIMVIDREARIVLVNAAAESVFGYLRSELLGQPVSLILPAALPGRQTLPPAAVPVPPLAALGKDAYAVRKDGAAIPVEVRLSSETGLTDTEGQITLAIRDLSILRRAEAKFQKLLEAAPDAIVVVSGEGQIVLVNTKTESTFGYTRETLLGRSIDLLFQERCRPHREALWAASFANPNEERPAGAAELIGARRDGSEFPVEISLSLLESESGPLLLSAIRDVTERKKAEQQSHQLEIKAAEADAANKAKSMFLSTMSHEIRTPMNAVLGYSQLMLRDPGLGAEARSYLKIINRSGEHLLKMIDDILDLAKIEAGRMDPVARSFHLPSLIFDLEAMFRLPAQAKGLHLAVMADPHPVEYLLADAGKIRQVFINLLGNAVKFTERGQITLQVSLEVRHGERLWLSARVADTGYGMTAEEQARLFRPFVQGVASHHSHHRGSGLGLVICQELARLMGGAITVTSAPGLGSTFLFEIPVESASLADLPAQRVFGNSLLSLETGQDAPRILIADDLADNREWLSKLLTAVGFSVRSVDNGQAAVSLWREWQPQLILMDIHMPVMNGLEAARCIRSHSAGQSTVIIALTADAMDANRRAVLDHDISDFVSKPCAEDELLRKLAAHLGVTYRRSGGPDAVPEERIRAPQPDPEQLRTLPAEQLRRLRQATLSGDKGLLDELIGMIGVHGDSQSARALQELADSYQYDRLIELLETACPC